MLGIRITKHHGNFYKRSTTDIEFGTLDADKSISLELEHAGSLDVRSNAHLQCAVLYTSVEGQRRVRVVNLALNVVELAGSVFQYADLETTIAHLTREGKSSLFSLESSLSDSGVRQRCTTSRIRG